MFCFLKSFWKFIFFLTHDFLRQWYKSSKHNNNVLLLPILSEPITSSDNGIKVRNNQNNKN